MELLTTIFSLLGTHGPIGAAGVILVWILYSVFSAKSDQDDNTVDAFKAVVASNQQLIQDQNQTLRSIATQMAEDRALHRTFMDRIFERHAQLEQRVDHMEVKMSDIHNDVKAIRERWCDNANTR